MISYPYDICPVSLTWVASEQNEFVFLVSNNTIAMMSSVPVHDMLSTLGRIGDRVSQAVVLFLLDYSLVHICIGEEQPRVNFRALVDFCALPCSEESTHTVFHMEPSVGGDVDEGKFAT